MSFQSLSFTKRHFSVKLYWSLFSPTCSKACMYKHIQWCIMYNNINHKLFNISLQSNGCIRWQTSLLIHIVITILDARLQTSLLIYIVITILDTRWQTSLLTHIFTDFHYYTWDKHPTLNFQSQSMLYWDLIKMIFLERNGIKWNIKSYYMNIILAFLMHFDLLKALINNRLAAT